MTRRRFAAIALVGAALGLAALIVAGGEAGLWVRFVLGKLAYSTSDGAALYLLAWTAVAALVSALAPPARFAAGRRRALAACLAALVLGHALNLALTWGYLAEMRIPLGAHAYHWADGAYSFTGLFHSHLGKTAFAILARAAGWAPAAYDSGTVFLPWVPAWGAWSIAVCLVVALGAGLAALPAFAGRGLARGAAFGLAVALAARGMIDGGPLAPAMPPVFAALAWIVAGRGRPVFGIVLAAGLVAYLALWISLSAELPGLGSFLVPLAVFAWLALVTEAPQRQALRVLLLAVLGSVLVLDADDGVGALVAPLAADCRAWVLDPAGRRPPVEAACGGRRALDLYREAGEDTHKPRRLLVASGAADGARRLDFRLLPIEAGGEYFAPRPSPAWTTLGLAPRSERGGWLALEAGASPGGPPVLRVGVADAISRNNYNVYLWEMMRLVERGGLSEFVLLPLTGRNRWDAAP